MKRKAGVICIITALICMAVMAPADGDIAADVGTGAERHLVVIDPGPVSYTHLTLPTICSV